MNLFPVAVHYAWFMVISGCCGALGFSKLGAKENFSQLYAKLKDEQAGEDRGGMGGHGHRGGGAEQLVKAKKKAEHQVNLDPMSIIPMGVFTGLTVQWLATTSAYLYAAVSYGSSAWMTMTERQTSIYVDNFFSEIPGKKTWIMEFVNEAFPFREGAADVFRLRLPPLRHHHHHLGLRHHQLGLRHHFHRSLLHHHLRHQHEGDAFAFREVHADTNAFSEGDVDVREGDAYAFREGHADADAFREGDAYAFCEGYADAFSEGNAYAPATQCSTLLEDRIRKDTLRDM